MKNFAILTFLVFAGLSPLACRLSPTGPSPAPTPTPEATATPVCAYNGSPGYIVGTPVLYANLPIPETPPAQTFVIHNLSDWQVIFGSASAPSTVDFNTQMIVGGIFPRVCSTCSVGGDSLVSVCEDSIQVTAVIVRPTLSAVCFLAEPSVTEFLVVPQSNLPVVWLGYVLPGC